MIVIIGRAGAGKTVQGQNLAEELNYAWISPGALLRQKLIGEEAKKIISGQLFNNETTYRLILEEIKNQLKIKDDIVLEGFPRSGEQAEWFVEQVNKGVFKIDAIIHLLTPKDLAMQRLVKRARSDDNQEAIEKRFSIYDKEIPLIIKKLSSAGLNIYEINGQGDVQAVHQSILSVIK